MESEAREGNRRSKALLKILKDCQCVLMLFKCVNVLKTFVVSFQMIYEQLLAFSNTFKC